MKSSENNRYSVNADSSSFQSSLHGGFMAGGLKSHMRPAGINKHISSQIVNLPNVATNVSIKNVT